MGCNKQYDENGNLIGFNCTIDIENPNITKTKEKKERSQEELITEFCNGESIAFGNDSCGIMSISKIFESEEDFLKAYEEEFGETYNLEEVVWFNVYYNIIYDNKENDGFFYWKNNSNLPENSILIGEFCGIEY
jgi:hypothetical protein